MTDYLCFQVEVDEKEEPGGIWRPLFFFHKESIHHVLASNPLLLRHNLLRITMLPSQPKQKRMKQLQIKALYLVPPKPESTKYEYPLQRI